MQFCSASRERACLVNAPVVYIFPSVYQRYKTTIGSTVTHYIWQSNKVIAEHNGSSGAVLVDYVYGGPRLIAAWLPSPPSRQ